PGTAAGYYIDALTLSRNANYFMGIGFCLMGGTALAISRGDIAAALEFHGAIEAHLDFLERSMPRAYSAPYRELVTTLLAAEAADAALDGIRARAAIAPQNAVLADLSAHLADVAAAADTAA
ncbi:MAG TPA: hypothetical protein VMQ81_11205, partial [Acidimicrobiia bacterium]|nr:hypothetical protein [Acidimicrobiia bacterium]